MKNIDTDPVSQFLRALLALGRRVRAERPPGALSLSGLGILATLHRHGPMAATHLAIQERLQPQSLTRLIRDLEKDLYIARKRSRSDRREIIIALTESGRQTLLDDMAVRRAWLGTALSTVLTPAEREAVLAASAIMLKLASHDHLKKDEQS